MKDLGENPLATMLYAIWDATKWWMVIAATSGFGLLAGVLIGEICFDYLGLGSWLWRIRGISCVMLVAVVGETLAALCVPMAIDSRKLVITATITNFVFWMLLGAAFELDFG